MRECNPSVWQRIEQRVGKEEGRWRVSKVAMMLVMLREFLMIQSRFEAQSPRQVLDEIKANRLWLVQKAGNFPARSLRELHDHLDAREVELYNTFLPNALRQTAIDSTACDHRHYGDLIKIALGRASKKQTAALEQSRLIATDPAHRREFLSRYLDQLRYQLSDKAVRQSLDRPFGKGLTKDREKTKGMSIKNWPVVGICIWEIYDMLLPLYRSTPRISKFQYEGVKPEIAEYPQELLKDMVELFTTEFPDALKDLTVGDVKSRIQYQLKKLTEKMSEN